MFGVPFNEVMAQLISSVAFTLLLYVLSCLAVTRSINSRDYCYPWACWGMIAVSLLVMAAWRTYKLIGHYLL